MASPKAVEHWADDADPDVSRKQAWTVGFSPSESAETKEYTLDQPGQFLFQKTDAGWDLIRVVSPSVETTKVEKPQPEVPATEVPQTKTQETGTEGEPTSVLERVDSDK